MKYLLGAFVGIAVTLLVVALIMMSRSPQLASSTPTPVPTPTARVIELPTVSPVVSSPSSGGGVETGTISGKLCYPSEFLPAGSIEAKSTLNQTVVSVAYGGSQAGAGSTYQIAVPAGTYILRYLAGELSGYHTDVCATGIETTCAADNERVNKEIIITPNKTVTGVDLCDFYYSQNTDPGF